ncbi:Large ribosomal subunit protein uL6 OS=Stutzerimonas stutzeri OX=316 GN=rplF PE=3 SV=1 [Stutzerimonas stutzeri]
MVIGVSQGFERKLQLVGVGYKAQAKGRSAVPRLSASRTRWSMSCRKASPLKPTKTDILIKGVDKQLVGQVAAEIRDFRRPKPSKARACVIRMKWSVAKKLKKK